VSRTRPKSRPVMASCYRRLGSAGFRLQAEAMTSLDADWASDEKDRESISGYCFYFLDSLVSWSAWKQRTVSTSSTESEYYALTNTIKEALWLTLFLSLTKIPSPLPFLILCDNQSTCTIAGTGESVWHDSDCSAVADKQG
jgi:hypothetical protein